MSAKGVRTAQPGHDTASASVLNPSAQYVNYVHSYSVTMQDREGVMFQTATSHSTPPTGRPTNRTKYLTRGKLLLKLQGVLNLKR
jgi:hypothetical protein